jgi:hypothetical protein
MKKYTVKPGEDLGIIARKFGMPSWKYLYQLNKEKIGDNQDLLKEGTVLDMPSIDTSSGEDKIKQKDADPFEYTGGAVYRYPWVALSVSITDSKGEKLISDSEKDRDLVICEREKGTVLHKGTYKKADDIRLLLPHVPSVNIGIQGMPFSIAGIMHFHPDDNPEGFIK